MIKQTRDHFAKTGSGQTFKEETFKKGDGVPGGRCELRDRQGAHTRRGGHTGCKGYGGAHVDLWQAALSW